jgi:hypothetical protein
MKKLILTLLVLAGLNGLFWGCQEFLYHNDDLKHQQILSELEIEKAGIQQLEIKLTNLDKALKNSTPRTENEIAEYNGLVNQFNAEKGRYEQAITTYNAKVNQANSTNHRRFYIAPRGIKN